MNVATVLKQRQPHAKIVIVDKEEAAGQHASGRNSGVLHAGFYYTKDSLKAQLTQSGNQYLTWYCKHNSLPLDNCGKLVVAKDAKELPGLNSLYERGRANGVPVELISASQARTIEPRARTHELALWSPSTSVSDPLLVLQAQLADAVNLGIEVHMDAQVAAIRLEGKADSTSQAHVAVDVHGVGSTPAASRCHTFHAQHVVNAAGLYADKVAGMVGFGKGLAILPFIGLYMYCDVNLRTLIYPVPELDRPFLGVHFTRTADGRSKIGPTAIPALWREQYPEAGWTKRFNANEMRETVGTGLKMLIHDPQLRSLAIGESKKYLHSYMIAGASELVEGLEPRNFLSYGRAGIRAQLVRTDTLTLEMDYIVEGDAYSTHVLNAISPAWTCSRPFAELIVDRVLAQ